MNLPNKLTLFRIGLTFLFMALLFLRITGAKYMALCCFIIACATDYLDGRIARNRSEVTRFGKLMDPVADKIMVLAAFLAFVELKIIPGWMVVVIISREVLVTGLRLLAASSGNVLGATRMGKHKMLSQMTAIIIIMLYLALKETESGALSGFINQKEVFFSRGIYAFMILTMTFTVTSGFRFLWSNRRLIINGTTD